MGAILRRPTFAPQTEPETADREHVEKKDGYRIGYGGLPVLQFDERERGRCYADWMIYNGEAVFNT